MSFMKHFSRRDPALDVERPRRSYERVVIGFMLVAVLGLNLILAPHEYDLKQHPAGEQCTTCDLLHATGHGVAPTDLNVSVATTSTQWFNTLYTAPSHATRSVYRARAPPNFFRA